MALIKNVINATWLCHLLNEIGYLQKEPIVIYVNNKNVIPFFKDSKFCVRK
jgi:hypothetical protein